jgi:hypothetical protein
MKLIQKILSIFLIAGMLMGFIHTGSAQARTAEQSLVNKTDEKIEALLLDQFTTEGMADFIVKFAQQADLSPAYAMSWGDRGWFVYNTLTEVAKNSQADSIAKLDSLGLRYQTFIAGNELYVWGGNLDAALMLAELPEVEFIQATRTYYIDPIVDTVNPVLSTTWAGDLLANNLSFDLTPDAITDWGITDTKADQFWSQYGIQGDGMVVANIDTGVQWNHPALDQAFKCGTNPADPACWADPSNICGGSACDNNGHGTHTMGTMVADDDQSLTYIAGMAPNAQWIACKGCESSSCSTTALNACADWILAPGGSPDNRPNVVNNSWGGGGGDAWYLAKVNAWRAAGIFPAFSAGNNYTCSSLGSPGDYQESFASAAHSSNRVIADFSSKGPSTFGHDPYTKPNISAPGDYICSSVPTNGWNCSYSGTSMASPHTAGAVALLWSCNPSLVGQIDQTFQILQDNANTPPAGSCSAPPDGEGNYTYGYGYLDVLAAGLLNCGEVGYLDGFVTSQSGPIEGASVTALPAIQGGNTIQAITDPNGYYNMTLTVGMYNVTAEDPLFTTVVIPDVEITAGVTTTQNIEMDPKGRLYGYVTDDPNGFPLIGATVTADDGTNTTTDSTGYYEMYLDAGSYMVTGAMENYAPENLPAVIVSGMDTQLDFELLGAISVVPDPIHAYVTLGQTGSVGAIATNNLAEDYPFEFLELEGGVVASEKTITGSGGPDPFGYTYIDSNEPSGALYEWVDATDGTPLGLTDDSEANVALPFSFNFYGTDSTDIRVGNNGGILFGVTSGDLSTLNDNLGTTAATNLIVPFWDDIDSDTGEVYYKTVGVAPYRQFIVEWFNRPHYSNVGSATFELILYETTNNIKYLYQDVVFGNTSYDYGASATVGIRQTGSNYLQYSYNQPVILDGMAICFQYPGSAPCDGGDVLWLGESIPGGTVPANSGTLGWTNLFTATTDAGIEQPGDYFATLRMQPTTGGLPVKLIPVIMTVLPTQTQGLLAGVVTGDRPGGPLVADILIESSGGMTWTLTTDPDGSYSFYLEAGDYTVTASAPGYVTQSSSVTIVADATTVKDFLLILDAPWIAIDPTSMQQSLQTGQTATQTLNISNLGTEPLTFEISERNGEFIPNLAGEDILVVLHDPVAATAMETALTTLGYTYLGVTDAVFQAMTVEELLEYQAVFHAGITGFSGAPGASETLLIAYLDAGGSLFISDNDLGYYRNGSLFYDTYLQSIYDVDEGGAYVDGLDIMAGLTLDISADPYPDGITARSEGIPIFQFQGSAEQNGVAVDRNGYRAVYTAFDYQNIADPDQQVEVINRVLGYIAAGDIPWLSEEPITGTVAAGETAPVEVTFDTSSISEPGDYTGVLRIKHNDPLAQPVNVPITLTVEPSADYGLLEGTVTGMGYCDAESIPLEAELLIENSTGMTWTVTSDPLGFYYQWLPADTYSVTAKAPDHLDASGEAVVVGQQTTTLDLALRYIESCMDVTPTAFTVSLPVDTQLTESLSISNTGAGDLNWEIHETTATLKILDQTVLVKVPAIPAASVASRGESSGRPARQFSMHISQVSVEPIDVLLVTPDVVGGGDISLLLNTLNAFPDLVVTLWDASVGTPTVSDMQAYDVVFVGNDILWTSSAIDKVILSNTLADYIDAGGKVLAGSFIWSYDDWGFGGGRFLTEDYSPFEIASTDFFEPAVLGDYDADSPLMAGITSVTDNFNHQDPILSSNGTWVASWDDGLNFVATAPNVVGLNQEYFGNADFGGQTGELLHNALLYLGGAEEWIDVPWVTEVPTSGITLPDSTFDVEIIFDSSGLTPGECYTGNLGLVHDDPGQDNPFFIPLSLCVVAPVYGVDLEPETSLGSGNPGDVITYTLQLTNIGNVADTFELSLSNVDLDWGVALPIVSFDLEAGQTVDVLVVVTIPAGAGEGDFDTFNLTAVSVSDSTAFDEVEITTIVETAMFNIMLPLIYKG